jgi:hypothetical protein
MRTKAEKTLHGDVKTITNRMKEFPEIQEALEEGGTIRLDNAETMLGRNIARGDQRPIEFFFQKKSRAMAMVTITIKTRKWIKKPSLIFLRQRLLPRSRLGFPIGL